MQPASAKASVCTGDGPATPALSRTIDAWLLVPENLRSPIQVRSRVIGGLGTAYRAAECECRAGASGRLGGTGGVNTGRFENTALISSQPIGRMTSRYVSR